MATKEQKAGTAATPTVVRTHGKQIKLLRKSSGYTGGPVFTAQPGDPSLLGFVVLDNHDGSFTVYGEGVAAGTSGGPSSYPVDICGVATLTAAVMPTLPSTSPVAYSDAEAAYHKKAAPPPVVAPAKSDTPPPPPVFTVSTPVGMNFIVAVSTLAAAAPNADLCANILLTVTWNDAAYAPFAFMLPLTCTSAGAVTAGDPTELVTPEAGPAVWGHAAPAKEWGYSPPKE
jgi:hypothetical protein